MPFVTDTHPLIWYITNDPKLSNSAKDVFQKADNNLDYIIIPCIVFFELLYLVEKKKIAVNFDLFLTMIPISENYKIEPICLPIIEKCKNIPRETVADPWDRLIAATSLHLQLPLITKDGVLNKKDGVLGKLGLETVW
ncbi:MAG: PIN domain-containing protein [Candidatus Poribacteria bacterium]